MSKRLVFKGVTQECVDFFKQNKEKIYPVKKLCVFFDSENFLLTPLTPADNDIHMIIQSVSNVEMHLSGVNCGYSGTGPHGTGEILMELGVPESKAQTLIHDTAIQVDFSDGGYTVKSNEFPFFHSKQGDSAFSGCKKEDTLVVDAYERVVHMLEPIENDPAGFFDCLDMLGIERIEYCVDGTGLLINAPLAKNLFSRHYAAYGNIKPRSYPEINMVVYGKKFTLYTYSRRENALIMVYMIYHSNKFNLSNRQGPYKSRSGLQEVEGDFASIQHHYLSKTSFWGYLSNVFSKKNVPSRGVFIKKDGEF